MNEDKKGGFSGFLRSLDASSFLSSLMAIAMGLIVGFVVLLISNPSAAVGGFQAILFGALTDMKNLGQVLYFATPIIMTGLSVGFANKTGLFNIGAPGQFIMGAYAAVYVGVKWTFLPAFIHPVVAILAAMLFGAIWGLVPGVLKAYCKVNEVISCIMMNYIGMSCANLLIRATIHDTLKNQTLPIAKSAVLPKWGLDKIFVAGSSPSSVNSGLIIAIAFGIVIYFIINKTRFGFELKACGYSKDASKYAGINDSRGIVLSMTIAGALAAVGGALLYLAGSGKGVPVADALAMEGFNGIPVALLGLNNPIGIILAGIFISYLTIGGFNMQLLGFVPQVIEIIIAVIIYFSAFALIFKGFLSSLRRKSTPTPAALSDASYEDDDEEREEEEEK